MSFLTKQFCKVYTGTNERQKEQLIVVMPDWYHPTHKSVINLLKDSKVKRAFIAVMIRNTSISQSEGLDGLFEACVAVTQDMLWQIEDDGTGCLFKTDDEGQPFVEHITNIKQVR